MPHLSLIETDVAAPATRDLIAALDAELLLRYPNELPNGIDADAFRAAEGCMVLAWIDGVAVGCAAFRPLAPDTIEIKRVFVRAGQRGRGVSKQLLAWLEQRALQRGFIRAVLETGVLQPEAIALYRSAGYTPIACFTPYTDNPSSVCFGKDLDPD